MTTIQGDDTVVMQGASLLFDPYSDVLTLNAAWDMERSTITESSNDISAISNLGSNGGSLVQATGLDQPTYDTTTNSFPVALFDGVDHNMTSSTFSPALAMEQNIFIAFRQVSRSGSQWILSEVSGNNIAFLSDATPNYLIQWGNTTGTGGTPDESWHVALIEASDTNDDQSLWIDGTVVIDHSANVESKAITTLLLGQRDNGLNQTNMEFYAMSLYGAVLSSSVKNQIGSYYAGKVGTTWNDI